MRNRPPTRVVETALSLLGLSGIAALFLPFTEHTSPWDVTGGDFPYRTFDLFLLGSPFLLAIPISAACLLRAINGQLGRPCWIGGYALAFASAAGSLILAGIGSLNAARHWYTARTAIPDVTLSLAGVVLVVIGGSIVIRNVRHGLPHALNAIPAMQVMHVAGAMVALIWLALWAPDFALALEAGAYFTLVTVAVYSADIALVSRARKSAELGGCAEHS